MGEADLVLIFHLRSLKSIQGFSSLLCSFVIFLSPLLYILQTFLCVFMLAHYLLVDAEPVLNTPAHCLILFVPQLGFCSKMVLAFHCLLLESFLNNCTPAVQISEVAISTGGAVISDNGDYFHRLSQPELMMNQAHYSGHM